MALRGPLSVHRYRVLGIRDLTGQAHELTGQLAVTTAVERDFRVRLATPALQVWGHVSGGDRRILPDTQSRA
ncbi:MAG TPA: hypothetical protein VFO16_18555 [Pseudonocardiaceae bacterium]|nr:hypothetical protein [Pseudonocardiaceae bacterium]